MKTGTKMKTLVVPEGGLMLIPPKRPLTPEIIERSLRTRLIGQRGFDKVLPYVSLWQAQLAPEGRPAGIFLLLGPTGVGKTHACESLSYALHGENKVIRVDCAEFQHSHEIAKLIGSPPGYLGHRETGPMFTQDRLMAARSESCGLSIVLFDEIEKASDALFKILLGVFDKGSLTLGDNRKVDFTNTLVFLTSNLGSREIANGLLAPMSFTATQSKHVQFSAEQVEKRAKTASKTHFPPEFLNRLDEMITFGHLTRGQVSDILDKYVGELRESVAKRAIDLKVTDAAKEALLAEGYSEQYGARELKRVVSRQLKQKVALKILQPAPLLSIKHYVFDWRDGEYTLIDASES